MRETIHQYVMGRVNGRRAKVGILVARKKGNSFRIGWSRTNFSKGDTFDSEKGMELAMNRSFAEKMVPIPQSIKVDVYRFRDRCLRYFKDAEYSATPFPVQEQS